MGAFHAQKPEDEAANLTTLKRNQSKPTSEPQTFVAQKEDSYTTPDKSSGIPFLSAANDIQEGFIGPQLPSGY